MAGLVPFRRNGNYLSTGFEDFYNMLDDFFTDTNPFRKNLARDAFKVDVQENEKEYIVDAELPGTKKEEISVSIDEGQLVIAVNREENTEKEEKNFVHKERRYSSMRRGMYLPEADGEGIRAKLEDGVLNISVPKKSKPESVVKVEIE